MRVEGQIALLFQRQRQQRGVAIGRTGRRQGQTDVRRDVGEIQEIQHEHQVQQHVDRHRDDTDTHRRAAVLARVKGVGQDLDQDEGG